MGDKGHLNLAIIGCGGIANGKHMPALSKLSNKVRMVAFCDIIEERAIKAAKEYGIENAKVYKNYSELLKDETIDVVHVCTPNSSHRMITVAALEAGKDVMCEKPMAATSADAKVMLEAAKRTGKKLTIAYQNRFRQDSQMMYKACRNGDLGDLYFAKAHAVRRRAVPTWGVFMDKEKQGGGPLIDIGTHALDLTLWALDNYKPKIVMGSTFHKLFENPEGNVFGPWDPKTFDVEDSAFGFIKMENGATIYLEASWALNITDVREAKCTICGTQGGVEMLGSSFDESKLVFNGIKYGSLVETTPQIVSGVAFFARERETEADAEAKAWIDVLLNDKEPVVKPEQAFVVTQILEAIYQSAQTGKSVEL